MALLIQPSLHHVSPPITAFRLNSDLALKGAFDGPFRYPGVLQNDRFEDLFLLVSAKPIGIIQAAQLSGNQPYLNPAEAICLCQMSQYIKIVSDGFGPVAGHILDQPALGAKRMRLEASLSSPELIGKPGNFSVALVLTDQLSDTCCQQQSLWVISFLVVENKNKYALIVILAFE